MLATEGYQAIMIDHLCMRFKITKGSFYHYFVGIDEYIRLLIKHWENDARTKLEAALAGDPSPEARLARLTEYTFGFSGRLEISLRAWALHNRSAKAALAQLDQLRINALAAAYADLGFSKKSAGETAELTQATWVGIQACAVGGALNQQRAIELHRQFVSLTMEKGNGMRA
jgi:AcrR family transcriptional regulator